MCRPLCISYVDTSTGMMTIHSQSKGSGSSQTCRVAKSMLGHAILPTKSTPFHPPLILHCHQAVDTVICQAQHTWSHKYIWMELAGHQVALNMGETPMLLMGLCRLREDLQEGSL